MVYMGKKKTQTTPKTNQKSFPGSILLLDIDMFSPVLLLQTHCT